MAAAPGQWLMIVGFGNMKGADRIVGAEGAGLKGPVDMAADAAAMCATIGTIVGHAPDAQLRVIAR